MVLVLHISSDDALYFNSFHENTFKCFIIMKQTKFVTDDNAKNNISPNPLEGDINTFKYHLSLQDAKS